MCKRQNTAVEGKKGLLKVLRSPLHCSVLLNGSQRLDVDSQQLADVTRFRDALGPGTLPLLKALFEKALSS